MKERIINYLKPSIGKVGLMLTFITWQYFYSYQNIRMDFLASYGEYFTSALSAFDWGNYFVRNLSLFIVWILVAVIIFAAIWLVEVVANLVHNLKVKKEYANKKVGDYSHLLKDNIHFLEHLRSRSLWIAGIMIFLISLFALSDLFERLRFSILDGMMWNALESGETVDFYSNNYVIASFVLFAIAWYFIGALLVWIFEEQKSKDDEEKISKEHFAIEVDTEASNEES
jgi:hypothetical protein